VFKGQGLPGHLFRHWTGSSILPKLKTRSMKTTRNVGIVRNRKTKGTGLT
jgi:hypothetical protein